MFGKDAPRIVIQKGDPLNKEQLHTAFCVGNGSIFWRAITQIIEQHYQVSQDNSFAACGDNNPMATAAALGAQEALSVLLADLEGRRQKATEN